MSNATPDDATPDTPRSPLRRRQGFYWVQYRPHPSDPARQALAVFPLMEVMGADGNLTPIQPQLAEGAKAMSAAEVRAELKRLGLTLSGPGVPDDLITGA